MRHPKHWVVQATKFDNGGSSGWNVCASQGQTCNFNGVAQVRYGVAGRYIDRDGTNSVPCVSSQFGGDPYPNLAKAYEIRG